MGPAEFISLLRKGKVGPAYFLRGPDRFLHQECRRALIASLPADAREWCLAEIEFQPGHLKHELEGADQMPMLGGHSFFLVSDPEDFKHAAEDDYQALEAYLERPSPFATVVFAAVEPDRRRRIIQLLEKKAILVEVLPLARREAAAWLENFLRDAGVEIESGLAEEIATKFETTAGSSGEPGRSGVNLLWLRTEMEKLLTAKAGAKRLERDDLDAIVAFREEKEIGKLLLAVAERKVGEALSHLRSLVRSKQPETLLLWCIGDLFRQTLKGATRPGRGGWNRFANPYATAEIGQIAARKYPREELLQTFKLVRQADLGIKSSWKDSKILLEYLVWQIVVGKGAEAEGEPAEVLPAQSAE